MSLYQNAIQKWCYKTKEVELNTNETNITICHDDIKAKLIGRNYIVVDKYN